MAKGFVDVAGILNNLIRYYLALERGLANSGSGPVLSQEAFFDLPGLRPRRQVLALPLSLQRRISLRWDFTIYCQRSLLTVLGI